MEDDKLLPARLRELSERAYRRDIPQHTAFLGASEQTVFWEQIQTFSGAPHILYGGHEEAERKVLFFLPSYLPVPENGANPDPERDAALLALFEETVACIRISPIQEKFSDPLTHRDYLGALMNLGIERNRLGDILSDGADAYLFCMAEIADMISSELVRVRHTSVSCTRIACTDCKAEPKRERCSVNVASERLDTVISAVFKLSRSISSELIASEKVIVDGRVVRKEGSAIRTGARVSVRGYGKFIYDGAVRETKKGRLYVNIQRFV